MAASALSGRAEPQYTQTCFPEPFRIAEVDGSASLGPVVGDGMSHIFLNYDDVRNLVSALGKHRPTGSDTLACLTFFAAALNTSGGLFIARIRFDDPIEGIGIQMTWEHASKLSSAMLSQDLTVVRHTDRLEIVADCFGWRADALMHHLKATTGKLGRNPSLQYEVNLVENFSRIAGPERLGVWTSLVRGGPGLYVVTGTPGNGVVHTYMASFLLAGADAILDQERGLIVGRSKDTGQRVYGKVIRDDNDLHTCVEIAANSTVIVSLSSRGVQDALDQLRRMADKTGSDLGVLKGMLHQKLRREDGEWKAQMEIAAGDRLTSAQDSIRFPHDVRDLNDTELFARLIEFATSKKASEIHIISDAGVGSMRLRGEFKKRRVPDVPEFEMRRFADDVPERVISGIRDKMLEISGVSESELFSDYVRIDPSKIGGVAVPGSLRSIRFQAASLSRGTYLVIRFLYADLMSEASGTITATTSIVSRSFS